MPWVSWKEWAAVREQLHSTHVDVVRQGIHQAQCHTKNNGHNMRRSIRGVHVAVYRLAWTPLQHSWTCDCGACIRL